MEIEDVLKNEDKAIPVYQEKNRFSNVYASLDDGGVLWWHSMESDERLEPVPLAAINEKEWGAYHEVKEIRPEKAGELWNNQQSYSFTTWNPKDGLCITTKVGIQVLFKSCASRFDMVHGRNGWELIYSPDKEVMKRIKGLEDDSVETIEIEGIGWSNGNVVHPVGGDCRPILEKLINKGPMKMILEIPKI